VRGWPISIEAQATTHSTVHCTDYSGVALTIDILNWVNKINANTATVKLTTTPPTASLGYLIGELDIQKEFSADAQAKQQEIVYSVQWSNILLRRRKTEKKKS
jgi:hypothetical protein